MIDMINYYTVIRILTIDEQLSLWSNVLNVPITLGRTFQSPFRLDKNPGCFLHERSGIVWFKDYADLSKKWNIIHAVAYLMNCTLQQASVNIYASIYFNKPLSFNTTISLGTIQKGRKSNTKIHFNPFVYGGKAIWKKEYYEYWKIAGVKLSDLEELNVYNVASFYMNDSLIVPKDLCIAYYFPQTSKVKLYRPHQPKSDKWIGTATKEDVWKTNLGHSKRIITKSCKDLLTLKNLLPDWTIWAVQAEGMIPTELNSFDKTIIIMDFDNAGIKAANQLQQLIPNSECVYFEVAKDAYSICEQFGISKLQEELKNMI